MKACQFSNLSLKFSASFNLFFFYLLQATISAVLIFSLFFVTINHHGIATRRHPSALSITSGRRQGLPPSPPCLATRQYCQRKQNTLWHLGLLFFHIAMMSLVQSENEKMGLVHVLLSRAPFSKFLPQKTHSLLPFFLP
uniref:Transmembrane protein n=1 Tax=Cucumis sativus TaxID=3659 RepID=A0A0A0LKV8_CUCSA